MSISNLVVKTKGPSHEGNKLHTKTLDALSSIDGSGWQEMPRDDKLEQCQMSKLSTTEIEPVWKMFTPWRHFLHYWLQGWWRIALLTNWFCVTTANCMHFICSLYSWGSCPAYLYNFWTCHWRLYLRHRFLLKDVDGRSNSGVVGGQVFQRWAIRDDVRDTSVLAICL